jgi:prephenate dehydrogenase
MAIKVAILGGAGKMGRWLAQFLKQKGFEVAIHSRSLHRAKSAARELDVHYLDSIEAVRTMDIVIVSTTIKSTADVIRRVSPKMHSNAILFDIASVKGTIIDALKEAHVQGVRAISVHPMFGPGAKSLTGKHVILIPVSDDQALINEILDLFREAEIHVLSSGEAHDFMMALTLALPHFLNIVFGKILTLADITEIRKFAGTTLTLQLLLAEAVYNEDPTLYYEIQSQNTEFSQVLDVILEVTRNVALSIKKKDKAEFLRTFQEARNVLAKDPEFVHAYQRFYQAFEAVT